MSKMLKIFGLWEQYQFIKQVYLPHNPIPLFFLQKDGESRKGESEALEEVMSGGCWNVFLREAVLNFS